jgi:biopolymer transport protein TolR
MADINVTPLVDVMLVLLIIFMVTAPMLSMGIDVNLPRLKSKSLDLAEEKLIFKHQ